MRKIIVALFGLALIFSIYLALSDFVQKSIYPAPSIEVPPAPKPLQEVELKLTTGDSIIGWHYDGDSTHAIKSVLLYFHGNGENLQTMRMSGLIDSLVDLNRPFLIIDYPGYGRSTGKPSEQLIRETSKQAVGWLKENHPAQPKVICGWSLGAAVALQSAAENQESVNGLIAMSAWSSLRDAAAEHYPSWLIALLLRERYDSVLAAESVKCPSLLIHGEQDSLIPVEQGKKVAQKLGAKVRWISVSEVGHNDLLAHPLIWTEIDSFLRQVESNAAEYKKEEL